MKVVLNCSFGENVAGDVVSLEKEQAQSLLDSGFAREVSKEAKGANEAHEATKAELDMALAELAALKGAPDGKDSKAGK